MNSKGPTPKPWTTPAGLLPIGLTLLPAALLFARQAIPIVWDYAEVNGLADIGGSFGASRPDRAM